MVVVVVRHGRRMAWLRRTCFVLAGGTAAALVALLVAAGIAVVGAALVAAGITPCNAPGAKKDVVVAVLISVTFLTISDGGRVTWPIVPNSESAVMVHTAAAGAKRWVMIAGLAAVCACPAAALLPVAGSALVITAVAATYAQLPPPDAAASTAAASVTRPGGVARDPKPAGEGEQHEVSERVQSLFRPAATGPIRTVDPTSGSTGWPVRLHSPPSRAPGDVRGLHLSRLGRHLRNPRAATVRWGEPVARGKRVRDSTMR